MRLTAVHCTYSWEFCFTVPSTSPVSDRSASGRVQYHVAATVLGSGSYLRRDLVDQKQVWVVCECDLRVHAMRRDF